ncbi:MAG: TlpA family protein disulfide reductase [Phycisphaerales bacterium]|nr:TlpA family protein disulfide reductase [Phycisphaerales bacterium]
MIVLLISCCGFGAPGVLSVAPAVCAIEALAQEAPAAQDKPAGESKPAAPPEAPVAPPEAPDCKQLFQDALKAVTGVKSGSYDARFFGAGLAEEKAPKLKGSVVFALIGGDDPLGAKVDIRGGYGEEGKSNPFHLAYDGTTCAILFEKDQVVFQGNPREQRDVIRREELRLLLKDFVPSEYQFQHALNAKSYKYEGKQDVEGVSCHVISTEFEPEKSRNLPVNHESREVFRARWFLAVEDHLPRRVEWKSVRLPDITGKHAEAGVALVLSNLKVNLALDSKAFELPKVGTTPEPAPSPPPSEGSKPQAGAGGTPSASGSADPGASTNPASSPPTAANLPPSLDVPPPNDGTGKRPRKHDRLEEGEPAPDWELADFDGKKHKLSGFRGKVVLLDFWATWCKPCILAMPGIEQIQESYKDKGVVVLGMNVEDQVQVARDFLRQKPAKYPQLAEAGAVSRQYRIFGLPGFVVIDADGKVVLRMSGWGSDSQTRITDKLDAAVKAMAKPAG